MKRDKSMAWVLFIEPAVSPVQIRVAGFNINHNKTYKVRFCLIFMTLNIPRLDDDVVPYGSERSRDAARRTYGHRVDGGYEILGSCSGGDIGDVRAALREKSCFMVIGQSAFRPDGTTDSNRRTILV